jgi:hypothetical protein
VDLDLERIGYGRIIAVVGLILFTIFFRQYALAIILTLLTALTAALVNFFDLRMFGIELATFSTVIIAKTFGTTAGALAGLFLVLTIMVIGQQVGPYMLWVVPTYAVVGFLAGFLQLPITQLGIYLTIGMHVVFFGCTAIFTPKAISNIVTYGAGNILLNVALFTAVAPEVMAVI